LQKASNGTMLCFTKTGGGRSRIARTIAHRSGSAKSKPAAANVFSTLTQKDGFGTVQWSRLQPDRVGAITQPAAVFAVRCIMTDHQEPLLCSICNQSINPELDRSTDEAGKPVHEICYLRKVVPITQDTSSMLSKLLRRTNRMVS
jgi:hypothetical protein